ncbi:MAG: hypothetical protein ACK5O9_05560 [Holosporales bacterium]|jgi:hypothetical protein
MTSVTRLEALIVVLGSSFLGENLEEKIDIVRTVQEEVLKHQMSPEDLDGFIADMLIRQFPADGTSPDN